jgi:hypothetical protein
MNFTNISLEEKQVLKELIKKESLVEVSCIINLVLLVLGVIGNTLCIWVYSKKSMRKSRFNWYLLILAVFELTYCFILSTDYLFEIIHPNNIQLRKLNRFLEILINFSVHLIDSYIAIIILLLSIDRYNAVKYPSKVKFSIKNLYAKRLISTIGLSLTFFKLSDYAICYNIVDRKFNLIYCGLVSPIVFNIAPTIAILIVNLLLVKELINYSRNLSTIAVNTKTFSNESKMITSNELKVTFKNNDIKTSLVSIQRITAKPSKDIHTSHYYIVLALSLWLVLTTIPFTVNSYYLMFCLKKISFNDFRAESDQYRVKYLNSMKQISNMQSITSIFFNSNHCVYFIVYFCYYSIFRKCIMNIFSSKPCKN